MHRNYENVRKWTKPGRVGVGRNIITDFAKIFIPINIDNVHWVLIVVYTQRKEIVYFDSLSTTSTESSQKYLNATEEYLQAEVLDKKLDFELSEGWLKRVCQTTSQQINGRDCGVHVCINALLLCADLDVSRLDADYMSWEARVKIGVDILRGSIRT